MGKPAWIRRPDLRNDLTGLRALFLVLLFRFRCARFCILLKSAYISIAFL
jgi:hypothetical protein